LPNPGICRAIFSGRYQTRPLAIGLQLRNGSLQTRPGSSQTPAESDNPFSTDQKQWHALLKEALAPDARVHHPFWGHNMPGLLSIRHHKVQQKLRTLVQPTPLPEESLATDDG